MINTYYDTGTLLPLYFKEVFSEAITTLVENRHQPIPFNMLQMLEMDTAIRLKRFRGEIDDVRMREIIALREGDARVGRLVHLPVNWILAMEESRRIGALVTPQWGCRTLDLLHVGIAVQWHCTLFVSADDRQIKAARATGLKTVDVRELVQQGLPGGATRTTPVGTIREKHARYAGKKRRVPH